MKERAGILYVSRIIFTVELVGLGLLARQGSGR
jgi:hypothetical protein